MRMPTDPHDPLLTRVQPFFTALFRRDAAGGSWLSALLTATPYGSDRLGELAAQPGWLQTQLAVRTPSGRLGCFEYPAAAPRELLTWFIDHPDALIRPSAADDESAETVVLRRALLNDDPPGSQSRAQERARELLRKRSALAREWWRFEAMSKLDCVLITDRQVIAVIGKRSDGLEPASDWYPPRSELVRDLEAAKRLADGKGYAALVISDEPLPEADDAHLEQALPRAAPHLDAEERAKLRNAYLGNVTWADACAAAGLALDSLPDTAADAVRAGVIPETAAG
jgi:hypothetical protein